MKDNKAIWRKLNNSGLSLVEVIVSMTLLVIVATILLTGIMASGSINAKSVDLTNEGYNQAAILEEAANQGSTEGANPSIVWTSNTILGVDGFLISSKDDSTGVGFTMFLPKAASVSQPGGSQNTSTGFLLGGNSDYVGISYGTFDDYGEDKKNGGGGVNLGNDAIFYGRGSYYVVRYNPNFAFPFVDDQPYTILDGILKTDSNGEPVYKTEQINNSPNEYVTYQVYAVASLGQKINITQDPLNLPQPSVDTKAGDLKRVGNKFYVFFPQDNRWWLDYLNSGLWIEIPVNIGGI